MDGPSYLYRAYHAIGHLSTSRGLPTNATLGMTMMLWKLLREDPPSYMGIAWDAPGPTLRHQQFEAYKLQRPGMPKDLVEQIPWVRRSLEALGLPLLEMPGYEADDILATAARRLHDTAIELVLVTADKDALQLVGPARHGALGPRPHRRARRLRRRRRSRRTGASRPSASPTSSR